MVYEIASDEVAKKKGIQVALRTMFRLRNEKPEEDLKVQVASIDELKQKTMRFHRIKTNLFASKKLYQKISGIPTTDAR